MYEEVDEKLSDTGHNKEGESRVWPNLAVGLVEHTSPREEGWEPEGIGSQKKEEKANDIKANESRKNFAMSRLPYGSRITR